MHLKFCGRFFLALILALVLALSVWPQSRGLKVYISADMEGITGMVSGSQVSSSGRDYSLGRELMIAETNTAIAAAFDAGATEVVVNDSHGSQTNLLPTKLDPRAVLITGAPKPLGMMQGIDDTFDAVIFIGYHARASTVDGVMDHTYSGQLKSVRLNRHEVGEYGLNGSLAGHFGVPVVLISGDRAVVEQARELIPGIEGVIVKEAIGVSAARTLHPEEARKRIAVGVKNALARRNEIQPVRLSEPVVLEVELARTSQADSAMLVPGMERVSGRVVRYSAPNMVVAYKVSRLIAQLARN